MKQGTVARVIVGKNYAFIKEPTGNEYFFHRDDYQGHWRDLERDFNNNLEIPVMFEEALAKGNKGLRANRVSRLDFPNQGSIEVNSRQRA
jgi:cold shock CspA family protein